MHFVMWQSILGSLVVLLSQMALACRLSDPLCRDSRNQGVLQYCRHSRDGLSTVANWRLSQQCRQQGVDNSTTLGHILHAGLSNLISVIPTCH